VKSFKERSPYAVGAIGIALVGTAVLVSLNYTTLPVLSGKTDYTAYFAEAGGLIEGATVQVSGYAVGKVESVDLDVNRVLVKFDVDSGVRLGDRTEAAIKTKSLLGSKILEVVPRGDQTLKETIPLERTRSPYQLPDALADLTTTISGLNTDQLSNSLATLSDTFADTPPEVKTAVQGVTRFSQVLDTRDAELRALLANAKKATGVLSDRADQVVGLIGDTNSLLVQLQSQSGALDEISANISAASRQIKNVIADNKATLKPALDKLNSVLTILQNRKARVQESIKRLTYYAMSFGEAVSSGPFFKAYLSNLLPGQFVQPFVDAAFSDLGLDPNVLLPSQLGDPQKGQPGTPPLPVPYPRTGQGGEPNLTLPGAITGNPGDPRYPYREPLPAPLPGGPPPGPPAQVDDTPPVAVPTASVPAAPPPTPEGAAP
jgi:phospholipid/cholesterol/gamma-HCH transport system substrate-binding protein